MRQLIALLISVPFFFGCTVARMGVTGGGSSFLGLGGPVNPPSGSNKTVETFNSGPSQRKVDILFVDDNSASMDPLQTTLGSRFPAFSAALAGLDWQIGITTTDCSAGPFGICGSLLDLTGAPSKVLTPATANFNDVFNQSIVRPETVDCVARGNCPSGISEPLKAAMNAMSKRSSNNAGFFRNGSSLAIVILTNADEANDGPATATQPAAVMNHFASIWGNTKDLTVYAIDVIPGDQTCLDSASASTIGQVFFGNGPSQLASLTGGSSKSICTANWTPLLQQIGGDLQSLPNVLTLQHAPVINSVVVKLVPDTGTTWKVSGNTIVFAAALPVNTAITVEYTY